LGFRTADREEKGVGIPGGRSSAKASAPVVGRRRRTDDRNASETRTNRLMTLHNYLFCFSCISRFIHLGEGLLLACCCGPKDDGASWLVDTNIM
jgi:hypothetical protein